MSLFIKQFSTHSEYDAYINGSGAILPNVSICTTEGDVHYNPYVEPETRVVAKFNVDDTSYDVLLCNNTTNFSSMEIDGVVQPSVVSTYTFNIEGEHTVKYTLANPTSIGAYTFLNCYSITSIDIPSGVTSIGNSAFQRCSGLTSIDIPDSVTSIGDKAFSGCSSMESCTIGSGVTSIGISAFTYCRSLTSVTLSNNISTIPSGTFYWCDLRSIVIPSGVTSIGQYAFRDNSRLDTIVSNPTTAPFINSTAFRDVAQNGTLTVPSGSTGYDVWMGTGDYYLGKYGWTKVEQ